MATSPVDPHERQSGISAGYYQSLHDTNPAFLNNNWLIEELPTLLGFGGKSLLEVGCGNGRFLALAAQHWPDVVGLDWARSPHIDEVLALCSNVRFLQQDMTAAPLPDSFDIVCSADFLEHVPEAQLALVMQAMLKAGAVNFHKIACYDDGHSHLSIFPPDRWLHLWHSVPGGETMQVLRQTFRKGQADKIVLLIANASPLDPAYRASSTK